ncbi:MAG: Fic family protein [Methanomassiliicoccaceae archaeon]|nr:Fic family protein [Methanomassiliicoccaceae archaeon]
MKKIETVPETKEHLWQLKDISEKDLEAAKEFNHRYLHYEELKYRTKNEEERNLIWTIMKSMRTLNEKKISLFGTSFCYSLTSDLLENLFLLEKRLSGFFEYHGKEAGESKMRYYSVASFLEEAISSSILEGAAVTRKDAKVMIRKKIKPVTKGQKMVVNNYEAMENIKKIKDVPLTPEMIRDMHRMIVKGTLDDGEAWEGRYREDNDTVVGDDDGKVFHRPPDFKEIPGMIADLCEYANIGGKEYTHPLIKAIVLHFMIGYIRPFTDGNGRLARSLFYWYSMRSDHWVMEYAAISKEISASRTNYGLAYQYSETDGNDLTYFIKFNVNCIVKALDSLERYVEKKATEKKNARKFAEQNPELNMRQATILKDYMNEEAFSLTELKNRYRAAYQTMRLDVLDLEKKGLVRATGKEGKKILYMVDLVRMSKGEIEKKDGKGETEIGFKHMKLIRI